MQENSLAVDTVLSAPQFGALVTRLIQKENLSRQEAFIAFQNILNNQVSDIHQGAFLAALSAKGETAEEVSGAWQAIYESDTNKVDLSDLPIVDNCGTGMDTFKTFNISTAASIVAAACGAYIARHGARALSSVCGTVDIAEELGVDVECSVERTAQSIKNCGLGLFNGMSPQVHPMALGRILSQMNFGSTLNISASLANPALPKLAVRGVYSKEMLLPVAEVMKEIGYEKAYVLFGEIEGSDQGMDEASVCGATRMIALSDGDLNEITIHPSEYGLGLYSPEKLSPSGDKKQEAEYMKNLLSGEMEGARLDAVLLNAALILDICGIAESIQEGVQLSREAIRNGNAMEKLNQWICS